MTVVRKLVARLTTSPAPPTQFPVATLLAILAALSVSSAVMSFEHEGLAFNLLDTPGHQDFSEGTYRTLTAVDGVVMVLDAAKGIEEQNCHNSAIVLSALSGNGSRCRWR